MGILVAVQAAVAPVLRARRRAPGAAQADDPAGRAEPPDADRRPPGPLHDGDGQSRGNLVREIRAIGNRGGDSDELGERQERGRAGPDPLLHRRSLSEDAGPPALRRLAMRRRVVAWALPGRLAGAGRAPAAAVLPPRRPRVDA